MVRGLKDLVQRTFTGADNRGAGSARSMGPCSLASDGSLAFVPLASPFSSVPEMPSARPKLTG